MIVNVGEVITSSIPNASAIPLVKIVLPLPSSPSKHIIILGNFSDAIFCAISIVSTSLFVIILYSIRNHHLHYTKKKMIYKYHLINIYKNLSLDKKKLPTCYLRLHYLRRKRASLLCSRWEQVYPLCYCHQ